MISQQLELLGFDAPTWRRLTGLLLGHADEPDASQGVLFLFVDPNDEAVAALHTRDGAFAPSAQAGLRLPELCSAKRARACFVMDAPPAAELDAFLSEPFDADGDYQLEAERLLRLLQHAENGGLRRMWPNLLLNLPLSNNVATRATLDLLLPADHCLLLCAFEAGEIWTAAVLHRGAKLDLLVGPTALRRWTGPLGGDWRRDQRVVLQAVQREVGPVHLAAFMARPTAERLFARSERGAWALAYASKELILQPIPPYGAAVLGLDAVLGLGQGFLGLFDGLDRSELLDIARGVWNGLTDNQGLKGLGDLLSGKEITPKTECTPPKDEE